MELEVEMIMKMMMVANLILVATKGRRKAKVIRRKRSDRIFAKSILALRIIFIFIKFINLCFSHYLKS